ncbi:hypothetical protein BGZ95_002684 [Linnemannia exigua]|uniref:SET domain-containing protein n=1 Tax=Linnemannia exigua TaxID=604196 RepID=A0AAD4DK06_9FUNG|nr:hypothetical protein BGZ95_002684 [Linnemannia exigua]
MTPPLASFCRWAKDNGVVSRLIPKDSKGMGVGLFFKADLPDNNSSHNLDQGELLFVPQTLLLSRSRVLAFQCPHLQKSFSIVGLANVSERLAIILFILSQRLVLENSSQQQHSTPNASDHATPNNNSCNEPTGALFQDYIATLPDVSTPVTLDPELVRGYLAGTLLLDSVCAKRSKIEAEFEHLSGNLGAFEDWSVRPTLDNFIWADATFWSRVLSFKTQWTENDASSNSDDSDDMHMVPYLDFANHAANPNIRWEVDSDGLRVWGQESLLQDSNDDSVEREVFLSYGSKPNTELLFLYGFTLRDNPTQSLTFAMPMDENDPYYMPKAHSLMRWGIPPRITIYLKKTDGPDDLEEFCPGMWITQQSRHLLWLYALNEDDGLGALIEEPEAKICLPDESTEDGNEEDALEEADLVDEDVVGRLVLTINNAKVDTHETLESIVPHLDIFPVIKLRALVLVADRVEHYITRIMETGDRVQKTEDIEIVRAVHYDTDGHTINGVPLPDLVDAPLASRLNRDIGDCLVPTILEPDHTEPITSRQLEAEAQVSNLVTMMRNYRAEEMSLLVDMSNSLGQAQTHCLEESEFIQSYLARMQLQDS